MGKLPISFEPYPDWSRLLAALYGHGLKAQNMEPFILGNLFDKSRRGMEEALTRRNEARKIRPSAFLACARQTYFACKEGVEPEPMPDNIGLTFALGHFVHMVAYAAVLSALPKGISCLIEEKIDLPEWWPKDERFNQSGSVDMILYFEDGADGEICRWLPEGTHPAIVIDFKGQGDYSYKKHLKADFDSEPDAFGYLSQLAVYTASLEPRFGKTGAILAGINRSSPTQPLAPRFINPAQLDLEQLRLRKALSNAAIEGIDPGEEFINRHGRQANFFCGRGGRAGYCAFRGVCASTAVESV